MKTKKNHYFEGIFVAITVLGICIIYFVENVDNAYYLQSTLQDFGFSWSLEHRFNMLFGMCICRCLKKLSSPMTQSFFPHKKFQVVTREEAIVTTQFCELCFLLKLKLQLCYFYTYLEFLKALASKRLKFQAPREAS